MASEKPKPTRIRNWMKEEVERLVCWMEENQQSLRGKQSAWHKDVKEKVFGDNEDITVKRIREKVQNMKNAWRNTRKLQEQSGEGVRSEDNAPTFNTLLESKCPLFWRLDEIWGSRPNVTPINILDSVPSESTPAESIPSTTIQKQPDQERRQRENISSDDEELEWEESPPPKAISTASTSTSSSKPAKWRSREKTKVEELQKIIGDRGVIELEKEDRRIQLERELQKQWLAFEERQQEAAERRFQQQLEAQERIVKIQIEAQAQQFQLFMQMMSMMTGRNLPQNEAPALPQYCDARVGEQSDQGARLRRQSNDHGAVTEECHGRVSRRSIMDDCHGGVSRTTVTEKVNRLVEKTTYTEGDKTLDEEERQEGRGRAAI